MQLGVPLLDRRLRMPRLLLHGAPGIDLQPFLAAAIASERRLIYLSVDRPPARLGNDIRQQTVQFLDAYNSFQGTPSDGIPVDGENPLHLVQVLEAEARKDSEVCLVLDGLGSLAMRNPARFNAAWPSLVAAASRFRRAVATFNDWGDSPELHSFGDVLQLYAEEGRILHHPHIQVKPAHAPPGRPLRYQEDPLAIHVPKMVLLGEGAGAVAASLGADVRPHTLTHFSWQGDHLDLDGFVPPEPARFDPMLRSIMQGASCILIVAGRGPFQRAQAMLDLVQETGHDALVLASQQDAVPSHIDAPCAVCDLENPASVARGVSDLLLSWAEAP